MEENMLETKSPFEAWLKTNGQKIELTSPFKLGRSNRCSHVISDTMISREHAIIQYDQSEQSWMLIDLNSKNGTYLNGVRIIHPMMLQSGDRIQIGNEKFELYDPSSASHQGGRNNASYEQTVNYIRKQSTWLLIADIKGSTKLSQQMPQVELSKKIQTWMLEVEQIIQRHYGILNDFMGDGILAFWNEQKDINFQVAAAIKELYELDSESGLPFRVIAHYGDINFGAGISSGREKLAGAEINFIFKLEKTAADTNSKVVITEAASNKLQPVLETQILGKFSITGFDTEYLLFSPQF